MDDRASSSMSMRSVVARLAIWSSSQRDLTEPAMEAQGEVALLSSLSSQVVATEAVELRDAMELSPRQASSMGEAIAARISSTRFSSSILRLPASDMGSGEDTLEAAQTAAHRASGVGVILSDTEVPAVVSVVDEIRLGTELSSKEVERLGPVATKCVHSSSQSLRSISAWRCIVRITPRGLAQD